MFASQVLGRELRAGVKSLLIWAVALLFGVVSGMTKYTALSAAGGGATMGELMKQMPESLRALLGFGNLDVTTMVGYIVLLVLYFELALAIHAGLLGAGTLSKEERLHTTEFLYSKPVARFAVATAKFAAALVQLAVLNLVTLGATLAILPAYNHGPDITSQVLNLFGGVAFVQVVFLTAGFALAALLRDSRRAGAWASVLVVATYFLDRMAPLSTVVADFDVLSPFSWFHLDELAAGQALSAVAMAVSALLAVAMLAVTLWGFPKRDLRV
ncbi:MAG: ABC transporter permease subunit [Spirochaetales bacterium]